MEKQRARTVKGQQENSSLRLQSRRADDTPNERRRDAMQHDGQLKKLFDELPTIISQRLKADNDQAETFNDAKIQKIIEENVRTYTISGEEYQRYVLGYIRLYRLIEKRVYEEHNAQLSNEELTRHRAQMSFGTDIHDAMAYVDRVIAPREAMALASMAHLPLKLEERGSRKNTGALVQNANASTMPKTSHTVLDAPMTYIVEDEEPLPLETAFVDLTQSTEPNATFSVDDIGAGWDDIGEDDFIDI